jgi:multidrug efflux pump subunit AcrA (membrane-fusion protein)
MGVRVSFLEPGGARRPAATPGVLVPAEAVRVEGKGGVVFVVAADTVQRRPVTLGAESPAGRQLLSGVREGERVVLAPPESLRDGDAVKLADKP